MTSKRENASAAEEAAEQRTEAEAEEQKVSLCERTAQLADWVRGTQWTELEPGGDLEGDDAGSQPFSVSSAVGMGLGMAISGQYQWCQMMMLDEPHSPFAPFILSRCVIEMASYTAWILEPDERSERRRRRFAMAKKDFADLRRAQGLKTDASTDYDVARIQRVAQQQCKPGANRNLKFIDATTCIEETGAAAGIPGLLLWWQIGSGFAHGRAWSTLGILQPARYPVEGRPGISHLVVESSFVQEVSAGIAAGNVIEYVLSLYVKRRGIDPSVTPLPAPSQ